MSGQGIHGKSRGTTGRDLVAFWATSTRVPENTAQSLRSACVRVLATYPDWETLDITGVDVEGVLRAFTRDHASSLSAGTLQAYRSRFRRAVELFLRERAELDVDDVMPRPRQRSLGHEVRFDLPLAGGRFARMVLPVDLTQSDVQRMYGFLRTLPLENARAGPDQRLD